MSAQNQDIQRRTQLLGWALFLVCSFFFIADSVIAGSPLGIAGSILFFLGCVIFLVPLVQRRG